MALGGGGAELYVDLGGGRALCGSGGGGQSSMWIWGGGCPPDDLTLTSAKGPAFFFKPFKIGKNVSVRKLGVR